MLIFLWKLIRIVGGYASRITHETVMRHKYFLLLLLKCELSLVCSLRLYSQLSGHSFYDVLSAVAHIHGPFVQRNLECSPGQLSPPGKSQCSIIHRGMMLSPQQSQGAPGSVFLHTTLRIPFFLAKEVLVGEQIIWDCVSDLPCTK